MIERAGFSELSRQLSLERLANQTAPELRQALANLTSGNR
jgi:hypothetical protein